MGGGHSEPASVAKWQFYKVMLLFSFILAKKMIY